MSAAKKTDKLVAAETMPSGTTSGTPQILLAHHLKQLRLPTILRNPEPQQDAGPRTRPL